MNNPAADRRDDQEWGSPPDRGTSLIKTERRRQINAGYGAAHDSGHTAGQLLGAAVCYVLNAANQHVPPKLWPWAPDRYKPAGHDFAGRIKDLRRAGALIAAEIDRLTEMNDAQPHP